MKKLTIGEFKARLKWVLEEVEKGETVLLQRGRSRKNVALIQPYRRRRKRRLGILASRGRPVIRAWKMSDDELLGS